MKRIAQLIVASVFALNVSCALAFLVQPEAYAGSFEMTGVPGRVFVQALGILFLMWNTTCPLVILDPVRYKILFVIVLVQQFLGLLGESVLWLTLPTGHAVLADAGLRFILFDGAGLAALALAWRLGAAMRRR